MSEPQRQSKPPTSDVPTEGIGDPDTVPRDEAAATPQQTDPGGYPHEPSPQVPTVPADDPRPDAD